MTYCRVFPCFLPELIDFEDPQLHQLHKLQLQLQLKQFRLSDRPPRTAATRRRSFGARGKAFDGVGSRGQHKNASFKLRNIQNRVDFFGDGSMIKNLAFFFVHKLQYFSVFYSQTVG